MAKIVPILGAMSGSVRGSTFSHNKGGAYVRGRTIPTNPTSIKQQAIRSILATLSSGWSLLSAIEREEWENFAALNPVVDSLGQSVQRTGQQCFVGCNSRLMQAGDPQVDTAPIATGPLDLLTAVVTATSPGSISVAYTATPLAANHRLMVWQTLPAGTGRNPNRRQARLIGITAAAAASPQVIASPYPGLVGQTSNFWVQVLDDQGLVSPGLRAPGIYV